MNRINIILITVLAAWIGNCQEKQFDSAVANYAEVRHILDQFYKKAARKHGIFSDYDSRRINVEVSNVTLDDGTEASANRRAGVIGDLFENDILLTLPQAEALLRESNRRETRQAHTGIEYYWEKLTISYRFEVYDSGWQSTIRAALRHLEQQTCFRFQENGFDKDYLSYFRGSGCWSNVGRLGGKQQISIGNGCDYIGIVAHETLHALGLWHEQSRSDRDKYIYINYNNIYAGTQGNFEKRTTENSDNMGQPYDLGSVMHYASKAFSTNYDKYTIVTRDSKYQQTMGQRSTISFKDAKMINLRYCQKKCSVQLNCLHGGYTDPNACSKCRCPEGYGGTLCNQVQPSDCGGELTATTDYQTLKSPSMVNGMHCVWRIKSSARVVVRFNQISFPCLDTCDTYVEIKYQDNVISSGPKLCCEVPSEYLVSEGSDFIVILTVPTDTRYGDRMNTQYAGFELEYKAYGQVVTLGTTTRSTPTIRPTTTRLPYTTQTVPPSTSNTAVTQRPPVSESAYWSQWGAWSTCSVTCGGCGMRIRVRACYGGKRDCNGEGSEEMSCGEEPCSYTVDEEDCRGRVVMPCDLLDKLEFETPSYSRVKLTDTVDTNFGKAIEMYRRIGKKSVSRTIQRRSTDLCEKRFTFPCMSYAVTLKIDWKGSPLLKQSKNGSRGCCYGYRLRNGLCVKDGS